MRLLLAEDDVLLGEAVLRALNQLGHVVDWLASGENLHSAVRGHRYDCILLDLGLPQLRGESFLRQLRRDGDPTPVIVITAADTPDMEVQVLDLGADDYLTKPFDVSGLAARLRAVTRRSGQPRSANEETIALRGGTLVFRAGSHEVLLNGQPRVLTAKEFSLLETLVRHRDRIVTRRILEESLYGWGDDLGSNTIEVYVHQLRRKLGHDLIQTIRGIGYRLAHLASP
jgi:DNA-binding response OmpR family regulator